MFLLMVYNVVFSKALKLLNVNRMREKLDGDGDETLV